ncbi:hypothetical protein Daesc_002959 [Daldinia eschscholtzii]|uniref:Uncharacterized protein n=1 Tax=Daldinia eschscholtzii TaxID=292717 RepID=A0AAX6MS24_9PEZI
MSLWFLPAIYTWMTKVAAREGSAFQRDGSLPRGRMQIAALYMDLKPAVASCATIQMLEVRSCPINYLIDIPGKSGGVEGAKQVGKVKEVEEVEEVEEVGFERSVCVAHLGPGNTNGHYIHTRREEFHTLLLLTSHTTLRILCPPDTTFHHSAAQLQNAE